MIILNTFSDRHTCYTMPFLHRYNLKWSYKLNVNSFTKTLLMLLFPKKKSSEIFIPIFCMRWRVPLNAIIPVVMNCYISERKMLWSTRNKLLICWYHINHQWFIHGPQTENQSRSQDTNVFYKSYNVTDNQILQTDAFSILKYI